MRGSFIAAGFRGLLVGLTVLCAGSAPVAAEEAASHPPPAVPAEHVEAGHAAEGHADGHGGVDFNKAPLPGSAPGLATLFIVSLLLFGGFVFAARAFVWTPLIRALDQRESRVNRALADAEAAKADAARLLSTHDARMNEVQEKVQAIVAQARKEAEQEKARIIAEADSQARALREQAVAEIHQARESALAELDRSLDGQVAEAVRHVVGHAIG